MKIRATAPGRVNLIGEHTDYNEGFVLPAAIDYAVTVEAVAREERSITARSANFPGSETFSLENLERRDGSEKIRWVDYLKGVCWAFGEVGYRLRGAQLAISSSVPVGSGLSSSAALEVAVAAALAGLSGLKLERRELAMLCWRAENEYIGVRCGVMDQFAAALSRAGHAMLLDCRSLEYEYIPLPLERCRLLIVDSRVPRALAVSEYNRRREECEAAVEQLPGLLERPLRSLRDLSAKELVWVEGQLPDPLGRRSRYIVEENERVKRAAAALRSGRLEEYGRLMGLSHTGLRDLYEVSSPELDEIVEAATAVPGVLGARMTGAGFGGCAIVLLEREAESQVRQRLGEAFACRRWREPSFYPTFAAAGLTLSGGGF